MTTANARDGSCNVAAADRKFVFPVCGTNRVYKLNTKLTLTWLTTMDLRTYLKVIHLKADETTDNNDISNYVYLFVVESRPISNTNINITVGYSKIILN